LSLLVEAILKRSQYKTLLAISFCAYVAARRDHKVKVVTEPGLGSDTESIYVVRFTIKNVGSNKGVFEVERERRASGSKPGAKERAVLRKKLSLVIRIRNSLSSAVSSMNNQLCNSFETRYAFETVSYRRPKGASVPFVRTRFTCLANPTWSVCNYPTGSIPIRLSCSRAAGIGQTIVCRLICGVDFVNLGLWSVRQNYGGQNQAMCETLQYVIITALRVKDSRVAAIP